jgi:peptidoglycan/LPS O-acetylase OafA/YrhL
MKERIEAAIKTAVYGSIAAAAGIAAFAFACIALFFWAQQHYDTIIAAAAVGGLFLVVALAALIAIAVARRRATRAEEQESQAPPWLGDPAMILAGIQLVRTLGLGRLAPILVVGAIAAGLLLSGSTKRRPERSRTAAPERRAA